MRIPKVISRLIDSFERLPGIGPKTAQRLTFYLLHVPQSDLDEFAQALSSLKKNTVLCSVCRNVDENDPCWVCSDASRSKQSIMVVEQPLDVMAIEKTGKYKGAYHVLHGAINPLENIGPDEIYIGELVKRMKQYQGDDGMEVIIATNPTMEGEATAMYIKRELKNFASRVPPRRGQNSELKITRLGVGIPTGADIEYADETTITQAIEGRRTF